MNQRFIINLSDTRLEDFDEIIESCLKNPSLASSSAVTINLACNGHVDARTVRGIIARREFPHDATIMVDVSMSGVSPDDLLEMVGDPRINVLRSTGNNVDTDLAIRLVEHASKRAPMCIDLRWNCISRRILKSKTASTIVLTNECTPALENQGKHNVVIGVQNRDIAMPIALPRLSRSFGLKDERLMNEFLKEVVGATWGDQVLRPAEVPVCASADAVIAEIPSLVLSAALRSCIDEDVQRVPSLKLYKFGSCVNGFGSKTSDVDLVVAPERLDDIEWFTRQFRSDSKQKRLSQDYLFALKRFMSAHSQIELVQHARIPVLKIGKFVIPGRKSVSVDITFMNTVCLLNSDLLRGYAQAAESTYTLTHLVKMWTKNNHLVSDPRNSFSYPTSYAWALMCIFFLQERLYGIPSLCPTSGPVQNMWGCRTGSFVDAAPLSANDLEEDDEIQSLPKSPLTLFALFLHFIVHEADDLIIDLLGPARSQKKDLSLRVVDPIEIDRVVTRNVPTENWEEIKATAELCLQRIEKVKSFGEFLDIIDTKSDRPMNAFKAQQSSDLFDF